MQKLKILIPTDFSIQADFAYAMAKKLGDKFNTEIHFLHVLNVPDTVTLTESGQFETCGEISIQFLEQQKNSASTKFSQLKNNLNGQISTHLTAGKLINSILYFSENVKADIIIMGTKGAWGLKEKLSGTETQLIGRKSKIPVLSIMCDRSDLQIQKILLVHNFLEPINDDLALLGWLINAFDAELNMLQITKENNDKTNEMLKNSMKLFAESHQINNFKCHIFNDLDVENGIVHFTQQHNMDLVFIGTHGKGGIFHSSITEKLINHLFKPVISFPIK